MKDREVYYLNNKNDYIERIVIQNGLIIKTIEYKSDDKSMKTKYFYSTFKPLNNYAVLNAIKKCDNGEIGSGVVLVSLEEYENDVLINKI